ncbi:hypothetical protein LCGC14_0548140 [marine sediment metagenome]|uniref:Uncharacterized protein n=1 Tax=marine sediment metagenome TaxID=412755 RepID=A0A0F9UYZ4_9ZZZZ
MISTLTLFAFGIFFIVASNYFLMLYLFNKKEKQMLNNLMKYLENEENRKRIEGK